MPEIGALSRVIRYIREHFDNTGHDKDGKALINGAVSGRTIHCPLEYLWSICGAVDINLVGVKKVSTSSVKIIHCIDLNVTISDIGNIGIHIANR